MKASRNRATHPLLPKDRLLPRLTLKFFSMPRLTAFLWIALTIFGLLSYTTLLKREGFPSVEIPLAIVNGTYFVNDPAMVDRDVSKPISAIALKNPAVTGVEAISRDNFFGITIQYKAGTNPTAVTKSIERQVASQNLLPAAVSPKFVVPKFGVTGGDDQKIDIALSFYAKDPSTSTATLAKQAAIFAKALESQGSDSLQAVVIKDPLATVPNGANPTGKPTVVQRSFDRYGEHGQNGVTFHNSVLIAVAKKPKVDVIQFDSDIKKSVAKLLQQQEFVDYQAPISASFAPGITDNISELQKVLLEGLVAILVVGSIIIAIRASLVTILSMVTVILTTIGLLYLIGYSLNVITLFGLILGLSLIVDDTIIMVEALEAARRTSATARDAVRTATRKVSRAMVAATLTAVLCFVPLALVSGVLGSFIRAIPITIISSLLISLAVALIIIPFFSRFLLLGKKQLNGKAKRKLAYGFEQACARFITAPMLWARGSKRKLIGVGLAAVVLGFSFIGAGVGLSQKVAFNIFPPTKDTNAILVSLNFPQGTTIESAQTLAKQAERLTAQATGQNFVRASYYASGSPQSASFQVQLVPYGQREVTSPQLVSKIKSTLDAKLVGAQATVNQVDVGPPASAFTVQIAANDRPDAYKLANDIKIFMQSAKLERLDGSVAHFTDITVSSEDTYLRSNGKAIVQLTSSFNGTDTTTLVTLGQKKLKQQFTKERLASYGLPSDAINFNLGQESDNQNSFKTLAVTFPILLVVIFILLAIEFRSLLQPLLIFMAIPYSIFGLMLGLYLTKNPISFFASLGFFALIGLSIKNTILLTDYANQSRQAGMSAVDAAAEAVKERFRPLLATSVTAIVSLIPLALTSPFWQGLAVVLIFGLASSTILVLLVFPYYYLGVEYLRLHISRKRFAAWFLLTATVCVIVAKLSSIGAASGLFGLSLGVLIVLALAKKSVRPNS